MFSRFLLLGAAAALLLSAGGCSLSVDHDRPSARHYHHDRWHDGRYSNNYRYRDYDRDRYRDRDRDHDRARVIIRPDGRQEFRYSRD